MDDSLTFNHKDEEVWFILEDTLGFRIGDDTIEAAPKEAVTVPSGTAHTFWNPKSRHSHIILSIEQSRLNC